MDIFHSKSTVSAVKGLVSAALDANMNMIRVWGGGMYYRDEFYDACDQSGLLIWQEAMFACSLYPANNAFLEDVSPSSGHWIARLSCGLPGISCGLPGLSWELPCTLKLHVVSDLLESSVLSSTGLCQAAASMCRFCPQAQVCATCMNQISCMHGDVKALYSLKYFT